MGGHVVVLVVTKLKLLAAGGHTNGHILPALLLPFILRLPLAVRIPPSLPGIVYSLRLLAFQLNRILFRRTPPPNSRRMARTVRLLYNRMIDNGRSMITQTDAETLHALSMASFCVSLVYEMIFWYFTNTRLSQSYSLARSNEFIWLPFDRTDSIE